MESNLSDPVSLIKSIIEHSMEKKDRSVTVFFGESGISISVYPITDGDIE